MLSLYKYISEVKTRQESYLSLRIMMEEKDEPKWIMNKCKLEMKTSFLFYFYF